MCYIDSKDKGNFSDEVVETNEYRVTQKGGCSNCPFRDNGRAMHLSEGRVDEIKAQLIINDDMSFTCHKTAYNLSVKMNGGYLQKPKMCAGAYAYLRKKGISNKMMRLAYALGIDTPLDRGEGEEE